VSRDDATSDYVASRGLGVRLRLRLRRCYFAASGDGVGPDVVDARLG